MGVLWGGGMGEQRASFRVDRFGGLYQNNTFVDYRTKRRCCPKRGRVLKENIFTGSRHVVNVLCVAYLFR